MQARVSRCMHIHGISRKLASRLPFEKSNVFSEGTGNFAIIFLPHVKTP